MNDQTIYSFFQMNGFGVFFFKFIFYLFLRCSPAFVLIWVDLFWVTCIGFGFVKNWAK
jgi:hypothetical protein